MPPTPHSHQCMCSKNCNIWIFIGHQVLHHGKCSSVSLTCDSCFLSYTHVCTHNSDSCIPCLHTTSSSSWACIQFLDPHTVLVPRSPHSSLYPTQFLDLHTVPTGQFLVPGSPHSSLYPTQFLDPHTVPTGQFLVPGSPHISLFLGPYTVPRSPHIS